jgi:prefoldin subunit 5
MTETRALTYREIAKAFDITVPSARNMVRRRMWHRMPSNDPKTVRVLVPFGEIPARRPKPDATCDASSDGSSEKRATSHGLPDDARNGSSGETSEALAILAKHIEALQAEIEPLRMMAAEVPALNAARDAARDDAQRLRAERDELASLPVQVAALRATLEAVSAERDRLADQVKTALARHASVPSVVATPPRAWRWPFRRSA